jgi:hypothetical protein
MKVEGHKFNLSKNVRSRAALKESKTGGTPLKTSD